MHAQRPVSGALPSSLPAGEQRAQGRCRGWRSVALAGARADESLAALLGRIFAAEPVRALRRLPGRLTFAWPADGRVIVKRFERAALGDALHDLGTRGSVRSSGRREAENLRELADCGMPVPGALGWCEEARGFATPLAGRSALWMERVEHERTLRQACECAPRESVARWLAPLAGLVARLHTGGWYHRDLYLEHWIVAGERLVLLDVGRARRAAAPRERWFVKDIAALLHSCPDGVGARARLRFLALYLHARGLDERGARGRAERRDFARKVLAKARRIRAHAPRFVDRGAQA